MDLSMGAVKERVDAGEYITGPGRMNRFTPKIPRACPVELHVSCYLATNVKPPRGKPVASWLLLQIVRVATSVKLHGASPWHP